MKYQRFVICIIQNRAIYITHHLVRHHHRRHHHSFSAALCFCRARRRLRSCVLLLLVRSAFPMPILPARLLIYMSAPRVSAFLLVLVPVRAHCAVSGRIACKRYQHNPHQHKSRNGNEHCCFLIPHNILDAALHTALAKAKRRPRKNLFSTRQI